MTGPEIDVDGFGPLTFGVPEPEPDPLAAAVSKAARSHEAAIAAEPEPKPAKAPKAPKALPRPMAIVWPSRTRAGAGHIVTVKPDGSLTCTCEAAVHGNTCWAATATAGILEDFA
jgi:hypothetical protein